MKILITVPILSPGSGLTRYIFTLCKILHNDNKILVLETHGHSSNDYAKKELMEINPCIKFITTDTNGKIPKYLKSIFITRRFKPDVIVSNYNALTQFVLPFCKGKAKVAHVLHNDTNDFYRIGAINGNNVDVWIAPTSGIAERFNKYSHNKYQERIITISHGVDEASNVEKNHKNQKLEIVFAGVLYEHKGVKVLPKIVEQLRMRKIDFHLTIIGGGILNDWLHNELKSHINSGHVNMTGILPHEGVYEYFQKSDIFLYPTHIDAFGLVIAEAMMNGAVPVVTHLPGVTDNLIVNGESGFLTSQDDVAAFVNKIISLNENRSLLSEFSKRARNRAEALFSMKVMEEKYRDLLNSMIDE